MNIVTYIAAAVENTNLYQILEPLQCSLRSYLPQWNDEFETNKINKVVDIMKSVIAGLRFLHDKHLVHFDLSLDTVAVSIMSRHMTFYTCTDPEGVGTGGTEPPGISQSYRLFQIPWKISKL